MLRDALIFLSENGLARRFSMHAPGARAVARRFVAGETVADGLAAARRLVADGFHVTLDYLGESVSNRDEARAAADTYIRVLHEIAADEQLRDRVNVSLKLTQMGQDIADGTEKGVPDTAFLRDNVTRILDVARGHDIFVRFDMEGTPHTQRTLDFFRSLWDDGYRGIGIVLQSYLRRSEHDVREANLLGARVRLCKGAYNEPEQYAFQERQEVGASFIRLMMMLLSDGVYPGIATHDEAMIAATRDYSRTHDVPPSGWEFQMLYGVRRDLQHQLVAAGYNLRVYVPFGEAWYPYLMRRMAERPSNLMLIVGSVWRELVSGLKG